MINLKEVRTQKFDHFKKQALLALTTAFRAPLILMMGCGYVYVDGKRRELHDHDGKYQVDLPVFKVVPYNEFLHGKIFEFLKEGEPLPNETNSYSGRTKIHRHFPAGLGSDGSVGAHEYRYE